VGVAQVPGRIGEPDFGSGARHGLSERVYGGLLHAYPARFRARYSDEMVQLFADQLRDARAAGSVAGTWFRTLLDLGASALGEHLRRERDVAQSLATFEPSRTMRLLGLFGVAGAVLLLGVFVSFNPFADSLNGIRLVIFALAGAAISLAFYPRQAAAAPTLAILSTAGVVIAGVWFSAVVILSDRVLSPFMGTFGLINLFSNIAIWVTPSIWAIGLLHTGAVWQGMPSRLALATKVGVVLLIGSMVAWLGDDRLGMIDSLWGDMWQAVAVFGLVANGLGWMILGAVLVFGGRGRAGA
jgi:hypothetical protein